jgi:hypothetical protein
VSEKKSKKKDDDDIQATFSPDGYSKLHAISVSSSTSIELIRMCVHGASHPLHSPSSQPCSSLPTVVPRSYTETYPWALKQRDPQGDLPLHAAIKRDEPSHMVICELLRKCPETAQARDVNGDLPLFLACRRPRVAPGVLRALLQAHPAAARARCYGNTALHHLLHSGDASPDNVRLLMTAHPEAVYAANAFGNLPLHYLCAREAPHILTIRAVLSAFPAGITALNKAGETPSRYLLVLFHCMHPWQPLLLTNVPSILHTTPHRITTQRALSTQNDEAMRERVRIMLRASHPAALDPNQHGLLRQLNWEARRVIILLCAELARRTTGDGAAVGAAGARAGASAGSEGDGIIVGGGRTKGLMDMYQSCDGVWR